MAVRVKDALAEKILEEINESGAFWVIFKVGFEDVFDV